MMRKVKHFQTFPNLRCDRYHKATITQEDLFQRIREELLKPHFGFKPFGIKGFPPDFVKCGENFRPHLG